MSSDPLGWRGIGEVVDLVERIEKQTGGIHLVVTDRPGAVRAALAARLPEGCQLAPLADDHRDGLNPDVRAPTAPTPRVYFEQLDPRDPASLALIHALNIEREWLMAPGNHAVIAVAAVTGRDLADADAGYLALQAAAPDLWSLRSRVYRVGGPDDESAARRGLDAAVADLLDADGGYRRIAESAQRELDIDAWERYRLWRGPRAISAWLSDVIAAATSPAHTEPLAAGALGAAASGAMSEWSRLFTPNLAAPAVAPDSWPPPAWRGGALDDEGQLLVDALSERLRDHRDAVIYYLPGELPADRERVRRIVFNAALLHEGRFDGVVAVDGAVDGDIAGALAASVNRWLRDAGRDGQASSYHDALERLAGALRGSRALLVMTGIDDVVAAMASAALRDHAIVAAVTARRRVDLAVCHPEDRGEWASRFHAWLAGHGATGVRVSWSGAGFALALRRSLACARGCVAVASRAPVEPAAWQPALQARDRVQVVTFDDEPLPAGAESLTWFWLTGATATPVVFERVTDQLLETPALGPGQPHYPDAETRALSAELSAAYQRRDTLAQLGGDTTEVTHEILALRRRIREGGQLKPGDFLGDGRYLLIQTIGRGGFATVWKAWDRQSSRLVAIKVLHVQLASDTIRRERFFRGARMMARLDHDAIVKVFEPHGEDGGYHYFVMELVPGGTLRDAVRDGRVTPDNALSVVLAIGDAVAAAHRAGLIHRDIKPDNVLMRADGRPALTDFDLVGAQDTTGGTRTGAMGTFVYAAPEMLDRPQDADARADVYGLGMTAIFALHGGDLPPSIFRNATPIIAALPCSDAVKQVLARAVDWDRDQRYPDAAALCAALRQAAGAGATGADSTPSLD